MQRQHGELVPIGDALSELGGPVKSIRETTPQARHHFTRADQVNQLVSASEADPERGFVGRMMALCSLPRTNPGNRTQYKRVNGPFTLYMNIVLRRELRPASATNEAAVRLHRLDDLQRRARGTIYFLSDRREWRVLVARSWNSKIELSEKFFNEIIRHPVPPT